MLVLNTEEIQRFSKKYPRSRQPLATWLKQTSEARWKDFTDIRKTFNTADFVKGYVVFDIHGNDFRLIAVIRYLNNAVFIENIFTHNEYNDWSKKLRKRR